MGVTFKCHANDSKLFFPPTLDWTLFNSSYNAYKGAIQMDEFCQPTRRERISDVILMCELAHSDVSMATYWCHNTKVLHIGVITIIDIIVAS